MSGAVNAAMWVAIGRVLVKSITLAQVVLFGRLLGPDAYSEFALAFLVVSTIEILTEQGLGVALIQRQDDIEPYLSTVWMINIIRGLLIAVGLWLARVPIATFFGQASAAPILAMMAIAPAIRGFENLAQVTRSRVMDFKHLILSEFIAAQIGITLGLTSWFAGAGKAAPVFAVVGNAIAVVCGSFVIYPVFHGFRFKWSRYRELHKFGIWVMVSRYASTALTKGGGLSVASILPSTALSFYQHADSLATSATMEVARLANRVVLPMFSRANKDADKLRYAFEQAFLGIACVSIGAALLVVANAESIVSLLLGSEWLPAAVLMPWIAVWGVSRSLGACVTNFLMAVGDPRSASIFQIVMLVIFASGVYPAGTHYGATGICVLLAFTGLSVQLMRYPMVARKLGISILSIVMMVGLPSASAIVAWGMTRLVLRGMMDLPDFVQVAVGCGTAAVSYLLLIAFLLKRFHMPCELLNRALRVVPFIPKALAVTSAGKS